MSKLPTDLYYACFDGFAVVLWRVNVDYSTNYSTTSSTLVGTITITYIRQLLGVQDKTIDSSQLKHNCKQRIKNKYWLLNKLQY